MSEEAPYDIQLVSGTLTSTPQVATGAPTTQAAVPVGAADTAVLNANPSRKGLEIVNSSATQNITVTLGVGAAVAGAGIFLLPGGSWDGLEGLCLWQGAVRAIASAAGGQLSVTEY